MEQINDIKTVAIYLRKSRHTEDESDSLWKHRDILVNIAQSHGWRYEIYEEIASGVEYEKRTELKRLFDDLNANRFDAVMVMDLSRIGRGNAYEWEKLSRVLVSNDVRIIVQDRIYNPADENDESFLDMQQSFAKMEYRGISRRLRVGKIAGKGKGLWTNGKPPFPYYYDANEKDRNKRVKVDEEKKIIYRTIVEMYLGGHSIAEISRYLNVQGYDTPKGIVNKNTILGWSTTTVYRLLSDTFHCKLVTKQKSVGNYRRGRVSIIPESQRETVEGNHETLKTLEEHQRIISRLKENNKSSRAKARTYLFSGVFICAQCGRHLALKPKLRVKTNKVVDTALCVYRDKYGAKCKQKGIALTDDIVEQIFSVVTHLDEQYIFSQQSVIDKRAIIKQKIEVEQKKINNLAKIRKRIFDSYENGDYSRAEFQERRGKHDMDREVVLARLRAAESELEAVNFESPEVLQKRIAEIKKIWFDSSVSVQDKNRLLLIIVKYIEYNRIPGDSPSFNVVYR